MSKDVIAQRFFENVQRLGEKPALLSKIEGKYTPLSYRELGNIVRQIALTMDAWGIKKGDRCAIISDNRREWIMADMANQAMGAVTVPIYPTLSTVQIDELLKHSEPRVIYVGTEVLYAKLRDCSYRAEHYVTFDEGISGENTHSLSEVINQGAQLDVQRFEALLASVQPEDLACINYTSGTTGIPKGVMLTNRNFVRDVDNSVQNIRIVEEDIFLSFLPLSHVLERMGGYYVPMLIGATIGFAESVEKVLDNMAEVRPTILISVPRLFEKIYATVMGSIQSGSALKRKIFFWALRAGRERMNAEIYGTPLSWWAKRKIRLADKLVFSKLQQRTGGRLQRFVSGGAPLSKEIAEFLFSAGLRVYEGYGLTETSPVVTVNGPGMVRLGSVGKAVPETEFKIAEDNEILVRGPQVMLGYYKNEAATREVIDAEGFLHTGDIGHFDEDGFLYLTDRKKNILITAGGKNVAPQPIEDAIKLSPYIAEVVLIGDRRNFISALITLDKVTMKKWADSNQIPFEPYAEFVKQPAVIGLIESEIERLTPHLSRFERVKKFTILPEDFSVDTGELTPSLKVKRKVVLEKFADLIDAMYREAL